MAQEASETQTPATLELSLIIKWTTGMGDRSKTRINRLPLKQLESLEKLGSLAKSLMDRAFPVESRPEYLSDELHYRWTPEEACMSYPMDVTKTEFKLAAMYNGWEYVVLSHELGNHVEPQDRNLSVTVIEFESVAVVLGNIGIRVSLVAYPVVCVQKCFLDNIKQQLISNPHFKGILSG